MVRKRIFFVFVGLGFVAALLLSLPHTYSLSLFPPQILSPEEPECPCVQIGSVKIPVELARDMPAIEKGLSGRTSLAQEKGMLFVFPKPDYYRFWMPDMNFPIDIIWITKNRVADMEKNVTNKFDPQNPVFYTPSQPVEYVLEVNAGFSGKENINVGNKIIFYNID